jgi:hypothetical protein
MPVGLTPIIRVPGTIQNMVAAAITVYFGSITPHSGANKKQ